MLYATVRHAYAKKEQEGVMGKAKGKWLLALLALAFAAILAAVLCMNFPMAEVHAETAVAKVTAATGETQTYEKLSDAFKAAKDGDTIDILQDASENSEADLYLGYATEGGTYTSENGYALYETDVQDPSAGDIAAISITAGDFAGKIYSENAEGFIEGTGVTFSEAVDYSYFAEDVIAVAGDKGYVTESGSYTAYIEQDGVRVGYASLQQAVNAIPSGNTEPVTVYVVDIDGDGVVEGGGVKVGSESGDTKNVIIDFGDLTYTVINPTVGSSGTETNGFQLLKGSKVVMQNGTLKAGTDAAAILIQKYCDLELIDMTIDVRGSNVQYAVSNNNGTTTF